MGILNATPDSFYDGGRYLARDRAMERALAMVSAGADIIDIGGEKAGPGQEVEIDEELERVIPLVEAIKKRVQTRISVDTRRHEVARAAVAAGADIINSITGFSDAELREAARDTGAAVVVMHIKGRPRVACPSPRYDDVMAEVRHFIEERVDACLADGIAADRIIIDPGPGFGKTTEHDVAVIRELGQLVRLPYPVLLAASRKKFIGDVLCLPVEERLAGSLAVVAWGVLQGVKLIRVHDVEASVRVCRMIEAVQNPAWEPAP